MIHLLRSELFRLRKRPQSWILAITMILATGTFYVGTTIASFVMGDPSSAKRSLLPANIFDNGMQLVSVFGLIVSIVMAAGLIGNEYSWNTIRPLLSRAGSRRALLAAKWVAAALYWIGLYTVGFLATIGFSIVTSLIVGNDESIGGDLVREWLFGFGRMLAGSLPYVALAFCLALVFRSIAAGIAVAIGVLFLEPAIWGLLGLMTDSFSTVSKFGLQYPSNLLSTMNVDGFGASATDAWKAAATLAAWGIVFVASTFYFFTKRDVTSG